MLQAALASRDGTWPDRPCATDLANDASDLDLLFLASSLAAHIGRLFYLLLLPRRGC